MVVLIQGDLAPREHFCDTPEPSGPRHPEQPCSTAKSAWSRSLGRGAVLGTAKRQAGGYTAALALSHLRPWGAGSPWRAGAAADPLSVLGAGAALDYLEQFGASSVSTQHCRGPAAREQALCPWRRRHPRPVAAATLPRAVLPPAPRPLGSGPRGVSCRLGSPEGCGRHAVDPADPAPPAV